MTDGREQRRLTNTQQVVEATLELMAGGVSWPTAAEIARLAGLSERSVFRYFDDLDELAQTAVDTQIRRADPLFQPLDGGGSLRDRIERLVEHRVTMFDAVGGIVQAARARVGLHEAVAKGLTRRRRQLRHQLQTLFGPELHERDDLLTALEVATGLDALQSLRVDHRCSKTRTRQVLQTTVATLLAAWPAPGNEIPAERPESVGPTGRSRPMR